MADPCTKFEVSSVSRCGDFTRGVKNSKAGQLTLTTPLSGKIFYRQGGTAAGPKKSEISKHVHIGLQKNLDFIKVRLD